MDFDQPLFYSFRAVKYVRFKVFRYTLTARFSRLFDKAATMHMLLVIVLLEEEMKCGDLLSRA